MGAGMFTYRIEDGRDRIPHVDASVFIVTNSEGKEIPTPWPTCAQARAFCNYRNNQLKGESH